ncbi:MAG: ACP phosphodiesterase [Planctomycetota bacterium]
MNYLAHVTLCEPTGEARVGALLGDFGRRLDVERLTPAMRFALDEHRDLDRWFDAHPLVREERQRYPEHLRRFAGILLDVFADHVLVRNWDRMSEEPLDAVTSSLYGALREHRDRLPPRLARIAPMMSSDDWLASYGEVENVGRALRGMASRMRRPTPLAEGVSELERRGDEIEDVVLRVWPEARQWITDRRRRMGR